MQMINLDDLNVLLHSLNADEHDDDDQQEMTKLRQLLRL
jgi:hypothetical protein